MMSDDAKKLILARRARFVAAALAGVSIACGKDNASNPEPCLAVPIEPADAASRPRACLSAPIRRDASLTPEELRILQLLAQEGGAPPTPCLSMEMPRDAGSDGGPKKP